MAETGKIYGMTAIFKSPDDIISAASKTAQEGYTKFDINTPYPVHGMDDAMKLKPSKLGFVTLFFGLSGAALALLLMYWTMSLEYPMVIGGKPFFALPAFIPVTFEVTVLLATVFTVIFMLALFFRLPDNQHPLHDTDYMKKVSCDRYGLVIESSDPMFGEAKVKEYLTSLNPELIQTIYYPERETYPVLQPKFLLFLAGTAIVVSLGTYLMLNKLMYVTPFDWMMDQERQDVQESSVFFDDGYGMRVPVEGTIARGFLPYELKGEENPTEFLSNPLLPTKDVIELGEQKYLTYCSPCHGNYGEGDSRLRGQFPNPPTLHSNRAREFSDGKIYHVITVGQNVMPSYSSQVSRSERWAIVNYIRVLQRSRNATQSDIDFAKEQEMLNNE